MIMYRAAMTFTAPLPANPFWSLLFLWCLLLLPSCGSTAYSSGKPLDVGGWVTYWDFDRGMTAVENGKDVYHDIFFFSTQFNQDGKLQLISPEKNDYRAAIHRENLRSHRTWMTIVNDVSIEDGRSSLLKDPRIISRMLHTPHLQSRHIQDIIQMAKGLGVTGVDIDYENVSFRDRDAMSKFLAALGEALREQQLQLSVTVQPKTQDKRSQGPGAMDWSAVCQSAHRLQIMLYNLHSSKTNPGPLATPSWITQVLAYARTQCPLEKIVPILKVSGMHWNSKGAETIQYDTAMSLRETYHSRDGRDPISSVPFFAYSDRQLGGTVYYEDTRSLELKIQRIREMGFGAVVFWSLGREDPTFGPTLKKLLQESWPPAIH